MTVFFKRDAGKNLGARGEKIAVRFLKKNNYKIYARNWYNKKGRRMGEIDVVAFDKKENVFVFVEVKTRTVDENTKKDDIIPQEQITPTKLHKLNKIAQAYISEYNLWNQKWRFDAITVLFIDNKSKPEITHIENIFL